MLPPRHVAMPRMLQGVDAKLQNSDLWKQFHQIGTEMIITKSGRLVQLCIYYYLSKYLLFDKIFSP